MKKEKRNTEIEKLVRDLGNKAAALQKHEIFWEHNRLNSTFSIDVRILSMLKPNVKFLCRN